MVTDKEKKVIKITLTILAVITFTLASLFFANFFFLKYDDSTFLGFICNHFVFGIALILIAVMTMLMTKTAKRRYSGQKSEDFMVIVSILLMLCGVVAIVGSFIFVIE